ncbi:MAG: Uma2 family endonuclease [Lachnospira sp.]|nr:Uma2 family endonuclease [Lachnospira sp.]
MMKPEELKEAKKKKGYTSRKLAELSGVPLGTIQKIMSGATSAPRLDTMNALERVLMSPDQPASYSASGLSSHPLFIQETAVPFGSAAGSVKPGSAQSRTAPENALYESIGGKHFALSDLGGIHQLLTAELYRQLADALLADEPSDRKSAAEGTLPLICSSPFPLELSCYPGSVLFPDVFVTDGRIKIHPGRITGVPVFIAEITSPSTRKRDTALKLEAYVSAGVSEYWVVDPADRSVMRCDIAHDNRIALFTFGTPVPVLTPSIPCVIDTARFDEQIRRYTACAIV